MKEPSEKLNESQDLKRASGAARRIVVQNLPPQDPPRASGRKLEAADSTDARQQRTNDRAPRFGPANASRQHNGRPLSGRSNPTSRQLGTAGAVHRKSLTRSDFQPGQQVNLKKLLLIIGGMIGFMFLVSVVLLLLPSGNKQARNQSRPVGPNAMAAPTSSPAELSTARLATPENIGAVQTTADALQTSESSRSVELAEVRTLSENLASQISRKSGYAFSPEFVELVRSLTGEYASQKALGGARQYRREINKSFRDEGLDPLIGYTLAMSRSRFDANTAEKGVGLWQIPPAVARSQGYLESSENPAKLKSPEASAQIAAAYTKALLSTFDSEDFMYAVACFGMSLQEAGRLQARLVKSAPDEKSRRDVSTKIIRSGVLTADQIDGIARFFAAGIVGENPQKFGLNDSQPFSSLY